MTRAPTKPAATGHARPTATTWRLAAAAVCLLLMPALASARAQAPVILQVPHVQQQSVWWCWAAVVEMTLRYRTGSSPPQCRLAEMAFAQRPGACCRTRGCQKGASLNEMQALLTGLGLRASLQAPPAGPAGLRALIKRNAVVIARLVRRDGGSIRMGAKPPGHVVVLRGMRAVPAPPGTPPSRRGSGLSLVLINDPNFPRPIEVAFPDVASNWERLLVVE